VRLRSPRYIVTMAASALGLGLALIMAFDLVADLMGLSKGASFGWAFALVLLTAVLAVGAVIDCVVLIGSCILNMRKAHG
jgi:hypothetical protein